MKKVSVRIKKKDFEKKKDFAKDTYLICDKNGLRILETSLYNRIYL